MIPVRQGDVKTFYISVEDESGDPILGTSAYFKFYNSTTGTYTIKGTATCTTGTVYYQMSQALLANIGTFQAHWPVNFTNNDKRMYIQDIEVFPLFPSLPTISYGDLATLKRYVRNVSDKVSIGNSFSADVTETDACEYIKDGQRYIDSKLKKVKDSDDLPLSTVPDEIHLAASILGAWFMLNSMFLANAPGEVQPAVESLKTMADSIIDTYIETLEKEGEAEVAGMVKYQKPDKLFDEVGVGGITYGEVEGTREDEDITDKSG